MSCPTRFGPFDVAAATTEGGTIMVTTPYHRQELMAQITHMRNFLYGGTQVPFRVLITDPETGAITEEHIAGCASCGSGGVL